MRRIPWFKVDDAFHSHPKVMELTTGAVGLWTLAGAWCADYLTDGEIRTGQLRRLGGTEDEAAQLVEAGLWIPTEDGYRFRDWHDYQPTRESVEAERDASRERQRKRREAREKHRRDKQGVTASSRRDTPVSHAPVTEEFVTPVPEPVPGTSKEVPKSSRAKPKVPLPDGWEPVESHRAKARQLSLDIDMEAQKFKTFHESKDNRYADWGKAFHTWLTRAAEYQKTHSRPPQSAAERAMQRGAERHQQIENGQLGPVASWDDIFNQQQPQIER